MKVAIVVPFATQRGGAELALEHLLRANRRGPQVEYHLTFLEEGHMADEAKVHAADVMDREGIKSLLGRVRDRFPRLSHLWVNAGYNGQDKGADWVVKALGWTAEIARHPP
jgi:NAD(P)-dependent dehydrogenase (short-subunit alcohol dehydrogenase family)